MIFIFKQLKRYAIIVTALTIFWGVKLNVKAENSDMPKAGFTNFVNEINEFVEPPKTDDYSIIGHSGKKTFMGYKTITDKTSEQYALQQEATTDEEGFRKIDDRYCVAVGTAFNMFTGQYFDVVLENGTIIKCIIGDIKKEKDTDSTNTFTAQGCCLEFIVDTKKLCGTMVMKRGDCSFKCEEWDSPCVQYKFYEMNYLKKGEE